MYGVGFPLLVLFVDVLGLLVLGALFDFLVAEVPVVEVSDSGAQVGGEAEPAEVGGECPCGDGVDLGPGVG